MCQLPNPGTEKGVPGDCNVRG